MKREGKKKRMRERVDSMMRWRKYRTAKNEDERRAYENKGG